jgi:hypothetical protein
MTLDLSISDAHVYVGIGDVSISGAIDRIVLPPA